MVEFSIKIHRTQRLAYIPKELYAILTNSAKAIPDGVAVLMFADSTSTEQVLESLAVIRAGLLETQNLQSDGSRLCARDGLKHRTHSGDPNVIDRRRV